jgi:hypothetical protein
MSDYDYRNPEDPFQRDTVFVAIVLAVVFGMGRQPGQNGTNTASNETRAPASQMAPPATNPSTPASPAPANPAPSNNAH